MQWIILLTGFSLLGLLSLSARRSPHPESLAPDMEEALPAYLSAIARRLKTRGRICISVSKSLLSRLENTLGLLSSFPQEQQLPAARHLSVHGRFLQEETAQLLMKQSSLPKLPKVKGSSARLCLFAHELTRHCTANLDLPLLDEAVAAWQSACPFTDDELQALPLALRKELLELLRSLSETCACDQRASRAASQAHRWLKHGKKRKARKLFERFGKSPAFQERFFSLDDAHEWLAALWEQQEKSADECIQQEHERQTSLSLWVCNAIESLRTLRLIPWESTLETWSQTHEKLKADAVYNAMDRESRAMYRARVAFIARAAHLDEETVASGALTLCKNAAESTLEADAGYYLLDDGLPLLIRHLHKGNLLLRLLILQTRHACGALRLFSWGVFLLTVYAGWRLKLPASICIPFGLCTLDGMRFIALRLLNHWIKPPAMPRMQLEHLSEDTCTLVICPAILHDAHQALHMVRQMSVMHEANPDEHLHFLLLGDFQDSVSCTMTSDADILLAASSAIEALCADTGHSFFYLQRERFHVSGSPLHHGRDRRRGALQTVLQWIQGQPASDSFAYASVDPAFFKGRYRFVITLDEHVTLPPQSALQLVGAMLHPLAKRQKHHHRMRGVSMIQPLIKTAPHSQKTRLSSVLSSSPALCDQLWLHRGNFCGNGIIDPAAFLDATRRNLPEGLAVHSRLMEGVLGGCALADDIVVYGETPQTIKAWRERRHRHTCGCWQLLPFLFPFAFPMYRSVKHALDLVGRFQIWRALLTTLLAPARLLLLAYAAASGKAWLWLFAVLFPALAHSRSFGSDFFQLAALPMEAITRLDAICRTLYRLWFSHQRLMDRTNAAPLSRPTSKPPLFPLAVGMSVSTVFAVFCLLPSASLICCILSAAFWAAFSLSHPLWDQEKKAAWKPTRYMREVLLHIARQTMAYFETAMTEEDHALMPDHMQIDPDKGIAHHTTPEDIGWYLLSMLSAEKLHLLSPDEMAERMQASLASLESLSLWHGLPYQRYDTRSLQPLLPIVSSAACGLLAVCLLTCAQGVRMKLAELSSTYHDLPFRMDQFVQRMSLHRLYDSKADLFWISFHTNESAPSDGHHDMLASEAALLSFVAILLGQVPQKHWFRLSRQQTRTHALISRNGSMSEHLLFALFQPLVPHTLLDVSIRSVLRMQRKHRLGRAFGVSNCACCTFDAELNYRQGAFGLASLAINPWASATVLAPYATLLAMNVELKKSFHNLLRLQILGLDGTLGLLEAADFDPERTRGAKMRIVRSYQTNHQGMILCAICNVLEDHYIASLFSSLPRVEAYRLLTEERSVQKKSPICQALKQPVNEKTVPIQQMQREARPLHFPIDAHLLSGGGTSWLIDAQGGGFLRQDGKTVTRFSECCHTPSGMRLYLRDSQSGAYWTLTDPYLSQSVQFESSQAVFTHTRFDISCQLRMWINPLDGSAIQCVTLENQTDTERMMEICSYLEPADGTFFQTERLGKCGVCADCQTAEEGQRHLWHILHSETEWTMVRLQCDRLSFLGRGRDFHAPRALELSISAVADSLGYAVQPCISLRGQFILPASGKRDFFFVTHLAQPDEKATSFLEKYASSKGILATHEPAVTRSMVNARFLHLTPEEATAISRMTGALCYDGQPFQGAQSALPSSALCEWGIQPDKPLLLLECCGSVSQSMLSLLLKAHALYRLESFPIELVIAVESSDNLQQLYSDIESAVDRCQESQNVHIIQQPTEEVWRLLHSHARLVLKNTVSLDEQLSALCQSVQAYPLFTSRSALSWKAELPSAEDVLLFNGYGGFTKMEGNYQMTLSPGVQTPAPWFNLLCQPYFATLASESGLVKNHWRTAETWNTAPLPTQPEETFCLRDRQNRLVWSMTRQPIGHGMPVRITYAPGEALYESVAFGIYGRIHSFSDFEKPLGIRFVQLHNESQTERALTLVHSCLFPISLQCEDSFIRGFDPQSNLWLGSAAVDPEGCYAAVMSAGGFHGLWGHAPYALSCMEHFPQNHGTTALLSWSFVLKAGESRSFSIALGTGSSLEELYESMDELRRQGVSQRLQGLRQQWEERLGGLQFDLPDQALSILLQRWIPYQAWMGGMGHSSAQLPDLLVRLYSHPKEVFSQLSLLSQQAFERPDELPFFLLACAFCIEAAGGDCLEKDGEASLLQRCVSAIRAIQYGSHDLPLIHAEREESVWLGMLLCEVIRRIASLCASEEEQRLKERRQKLLAAIDRHAWDGSWYLSGWDEAAQKLGSRNSSTHRIELLPQVWAVLCGASRDRCVIAMENVWHMLYDRGASIVRRSAPSDELLAPSVEACLTVMALHQLGQEERAWELALRMLPTARSATRQLASRSRMEPYALPSAICIHPQQRGQAIGQWSPGAAGAYWHMMVYQLLGLRKQGDFLRLCPVVPAHWDSFRITYRYGSATYHLHASRDCASCSADGEPLADSLLPLHDDGRIHEAFFPIR